MWVLPRPRRNGIARYGTVGVFAIRNKRPNQRSLLSWIWSIFWVSTQYQISNVTAAHTITSCNFTKRTSCFIVIQYIHIYSHSQAKAQKRLTAAPLTFRLAHKFILMLSQAVYRHNVTPSSDDLSTNLTNDRMRSLISKILKTSDIKNWKTSNQAPVAWSSQVLKPYGHRCIGSYRTAPFTEATKVNS